MSTDLVEKNRNQLNKLCYICTMQFSRTIKIIQKNIHSMERDIVKLNYMYSIIPFDSQKYMDAQIKDEKNNQ